VTISSNNRVRIKYTVSFENDRRKPLEVDLMDNTIARRDNSEIVKSLLPPLKEGKSFLISTELEFFIFLLGVSPSGEINLNRVIND